MLISLKKKVKLCSVSNLWPRSEKPLSCKSAKKIKYLFQPLDVFLRCRCFACHVLLRISSYFRRCLFAFKAPGLWSGNGKWKCFMAGGINGGNVRNATLVLSDPVF
uniref:Uncharacterized protein n=1 Tax=Anguilla anguilla TaxID=7936 RepID=A0A0E9VM06_ANGAN